MSATKLMTNLSTMRYQWRKKGLPWSGKAVSTDLLNAYLMARREFLEAKQTGCSAAKYVRLQSQIEKAQARIVAVLTKAELAQCEDVTTGLGATREEDEPLPTFEVKAPDLTAPATAAQEEVAGDKALEAQVKALKAELKRREKENTLQSQRISSFIAMADKEAQARDDEIAQLKKQLAVAEDSERIRAAMEERPCMCTAAGSHSDHGADARAFHYGPCVAPHGLVCVGGTLKPIGVKA
jgi:hypothetical protein